MTPDQNTQRSQTDLPAISPAFRRGKAISAETGGLTGSILRQKPTDNPHDHKPRIRHVLQKM
ncbi:MAG TPA: hypothetical protein PK643_10575 [Saprospiraceae bacterium]|nr:hypothetical protein [Saprospiraceae bacterium]